MKIEAAVVREYGGSFSIEEIELEKPRANEVLVEIKAVGVCHSDAGVRAGALPLPLPIVLGHEGAGVVQEVGEGVVGLEPGDHVVLAFDTCGHCHNCESGDQAYCDEYIPRNISGGRIDGTSPLSSQGERVNGAFFGQSSFATHVIASQRSVVKVSKELDLSVIAPISCGIQTGAGTVINRLKPEVGSSIAVFGSGAVGCAAIMAAKIVGCTTIIGIDIDDSRLELAKSLGATHTINSKDANVAERIAEITGAGVDYTIDTTSIPAVMGEAIAVLSRKGTCVLLGIGSNEVPVGLDQLVMGGKTVTGVISGDSNSKLFIPTLLDFYSNGELPIDKLVKRFSFSEINEAFEAAASGSVIKPVLVHD